MISYHKILPKVFVYKNLIPNAAKYCQRLKEIHDNADEESLLFNRIQPWSTFGTSVNYEAKFDKVALEDKARLEITKNPHRKETIELEKEIIETVESAFISATDHYLKEFELLHKKEDWVISAPSYDRYWPTKEEHIRGTGHGLRLAMSHHSDFQLEREEQPGLQYVLTVTIYLNDDYEGGEVLFLNGGTQTPYKPQAGDVLVFPSGNPRYLSEDGRYFHGVTAVENSDKYFCRSFYTEYFEGSEEWLANQEKYGAEVWEKMEQVRIASGLRKLNSDPIVLLQDTDSIPEIDQYILDILKESGVDPERECGLEEFRS